MPASVLALAGGLDPRKVKLVTFHLKEDKNRLDPDKCAAITVSLPITNERVRSCLGTDDVFGFPVLSRVDPSSPIQTQIPMSMQRNC